jgi:cytochrome c-type biogenesis protein CcmH
VIRALLVATAALALASPAAACTKYASQGSLETQLVCPSCHTTLDESDSEVAREMKAEIARRIARCQTAKQIRDAMVAEFGPTILSTPQTHGFDLLAWVLPLGGAGAGAVALAFAARAWTRGRTPASANLAQSGLTPEDERRVDEALERFDG